MSLDSVTERCSCGAEIAYSGYDVRGMTRAWRSDHRHIAPVTAADAAVIAASIEDFRNTWRDLCSLLDAIGRVAKADDDGVTS